MTDRWRRNRSFRARAGVATLLVLATAPGSSSGQALPEAVAAFDGERALAHAAAMVALGPRPLGSDALEQNRVYIEQQLRAVGLDPRRQPFEATTPLGAVPMANILADVTPSDPDAPGPVLLVAGHYDTKLFQGVEFVGANDGASSAALLLELARVLTLHPPGIPVRLAFFDGEEAVVQWGGTDSTYGSRHMVAELQREGHLGEIGALVLFDMIGDADLRIPREIGSTRWLTDVIWEAAARAGHSDAFPSTLQAIEDDHLPFLEAGVDAVDLIDFDYGPGNRYWHSPFDTLDKLSAESFRAVGETFLTALPEIEEALALMR